VKDRETTVRGLMTTGRDDHKERTRSRRRKKPIPDEAREVWVQRKEKSDPKKRQAGQNHQPNIYRAKEKKSEKWQDQGPTAIRRERIWGSPREQCVLIRREGEDRGLGISNLRRKTGVCGWGNQGGISGEEGSLEGGSTVADRFVQTQNGKFGGGKINKRS